MLVHHIDILLFGMASTKCLLLLLPLLQLDKVKEDANSDKLINNILNKHSQFKNNSDVNDMLKRIFYDDFKTETYLNQNNISYLYELRLLKESFVKLYVESINNLTGEYSHVFDLHTRIKKYEIQISRLRMIIEPEVQVSINVHTTTKIEYLNAKSYWITDTGRKVRKFSKSIGKLDDFKDGRLGTKAREVGCATMQEIMYQHYKNIYK